MDESPTVTPQEAPPPAAAVAPKPKGKKLKRVLVGGVVAFAGMSLLYGPANTAQMLALSVICTAGIGLIPLLFVCWAVGWIVLEIWGSITARRGATATA